MKLECEMLLQKVFSFRKEWKQNLSEELGLNFEAIFDTSRNKH